MSNYQRINANSVALGENNGQATLESANDNKLNVKANIVANDNTPVITYTDSSNTIDFHNKPVVNFSGGGGGGGGDAFLNGGTALVTPQEWTGFNRFDNDTQFREGVVFSDNGVDINGRIHASASQLHLQTNNSLDTISMKLDTAGSTNTLELKQDPDATTQNGLFIQQVAGSSTLEKVLTDSTQDLGVIVDAVEASPNTFTAANTFTAQTTTTGITNTGGLTNSNGMVNTGGLTSDVMTCQGLLSTQSINSTQSITSVGITNSSGLSNTGGLTSDVMTCQGLLNTQSLTATSTILGNEVLSSGNITCGVGSNFIVGSAQIASSNLSDSNTLLNTSATAQAKTGNLTVSQLTTSAGVLSFTVGDGANIQNDTTNNVLITSTTNATDGMNWRLGTDSDDTLRLRYDANGGGAGVPRYFLEMIDPSIVSDPPTYFSLTGNSTYDIANLTALLNNTSLTFNPTTTLGVQGTLTHIGANALLIGGASNSTLNIGLSSSTDVVNIEASVNFDGTNTHTFGTNSTVILNGTTTLASGLTDIGKSGFSYGVFGQLEALTNRSLAAWQPIVTSITPISGYTNQITNLFDASFVRVQYGTNFQISMRGGFRVTPTVPPTVPTPTFPIGNLVIANIGSTYAPSKNMYFNYQLQPGVPGGMINLTSTGDLLLIGLTGNEVEIYLGGISYWVN